MVYEFWSGVKNTNNTDAASYLAPGECGPDNLTILTRDDPRARRLLAALLAKMNIRLTETESVLIPAGGSTASVFAEFTMPDMDYLAQKVRAIVDDYLARYAELFKTMTEEQIADMALEQVIDEINKAPTVTVGVDVDCLWDKDSKSWKMASNPLDELGLDKVIEEFEAL